MNHLAIVFGYIGHLYAIRCATDWDRRLPTAQKDLWWTNMNAWSLATHGRAFRWRRP